METADLDLLEDVSREDRSVPSSGVCGRKNALFRLREGSRLHTSERQARLSAQWVGVAAKRDTRWRCCIPNGRL